ncbi:MAG: hypothetical protein H6551_11540 [Chitinophagales bacterium]|nr:hypothetical protein [Chitinophagaceae bacterium]MCB9065760.1 hypothetical protein [Chitinophagales bacterium]
MKNKGVITALLLFVTIAISSTGYAQQCKSPAKWFADTYAVFEKYGGSHKYATAAKMAIKFINSNTNGWGKIGPRSLALPGSANGTLQGLGDRTFITVPCNKNSVTITVKKTGGQAKAEVTICSYNTSGKGGKNLHVYSFKPGPGNASKSFKVDGVNGKMISVRMNGQTATKKFEYSISAK